MAADLLRDDIRERGQLAQRRYQWNYHQQGWVQVWNHIPRAPKQTQRCGEETEAVVHKVEKRGETLQKSELEGKELVVVVNVQELVEEELSEVVVVVECHGKQEAVGKRRQHFGQKIPEFLRFEKTRRAWGFSPLLLTWFQVTRTLQKPVYEPQLRCLFPIAN